MCVAHAHRDLTGPRAQLEAVMWLKPRSRAVILHAICMFPGCYEGARDIFCVIFPWALLLGVQLHTRGHTGTFSITQQGAKRTTSIGYSDKV